MRCDVVRSVHGESHAACVHTGTRRHDRCDECVMSTHVVGCWMPVRVRNENETDPESISDPHRPGTPSTRGQEQGDVRMKASSGNRVAVSDLKLLANWCSTSMRNFLFEGSFQSAQIGCIRAWDACKSITIEFERSEVMYVCSDRSWKQRMDRCERRGEAIARVCRRVRNEDGGARCRWMNCSCSE
jgi:hypothetical protein